MFLIVKIRMTWYSIFTWCVICNTVNIIVAYVQLVKQKLFMRNYSIYIFERKVLMNLLAIRLQSLLDKNNIKPTVLAKAINVNKSTISRILNGSTIPSVDTVYRISLYFNVKMEYFMNSESCLYATNDSDELKLLDAYRQLSPLDQNEIFELIQFKLYRVSQEKMHMRKTKLSESLTTEESATIEKMA